MLKKTFNYLIKIEYDGTNFIGWQIQKKGRSVQGQIEKVLKKIFKTKIRIIGAGRTDKGVHAFEQCASFKTDKEIKNKIQFLDSSNYFLREDSISILDVQKKDKTFNSRFSAKERTYEYRIINRRGYPALNKHKAWHIKKKLDLQLLKKGVKLLKGTHNFSTFRAASCSAFSPIKKINLAQVKIKGESITITFKSRSFLQNQVRSMVGSLIYLSSDKWTLRFFKKVFKSKKRELCAPPAPAHGLFLKKIKYK